MARTTGRSAVTMGALQHINIRCADLERSRDFYVEVMGLTVGPRPPFASRGYWLYAAATGGEDLGEPMVHLVQKLPDEPVRGPGTGELDHVAFAGHDLAAFRETLARLDIAFREQVVPRDEVVQVFVRDPEGVQIELNFAPEPSAPAPVAQ